MKPFTRDAYTPDALVQAGVPPELVRTLLVDPKRASPEHARLSVTGRKRTTTPTLEYGWGPDVNYLLGLEKPR